MLVEAGFGVIAPYARQRLAGIDGSKHAGRGDTQLGFQGDLGQYPGPFLHPRVQPLGRRDRIESFAGRDQNGFVKSEGGLQAVKSVPHHGRDSGLSFRAERIPPVRVLGDPGVQVGTVKTAELRQTDIERQPAAELVGWASRTGQIGDIMAEVAQDRRPDQVCRRQVVRRFHSVRKLHRAAQHICPKVGSRLRHHPPPGFGGQTPAQGRNRQRGLTDIRLSRHNGLPRVIYLQRLGEAGDLLFCPVIRQPPRGAQRSAHDPSRHPGRPESQQPAALQLRVNPDKITLRQDHILNNPFEEKGGFAPRVMDIRPGRL